MNRQFLLISVFVCLLGCSGPKIEVVEVEGVVTQNGKPLPEVSITFSPDPEKECFGKSSSAITDESGKYRLKYLGGNPEYGAEVGWHRITAQDYMAENSRDNPIPPRIATKYSLVGKTDLEFEVKPGEAQTKDFELEPRQ
jgi:hypothetical protein